MYKLLLKRYKCYFNKNSVLIIVTSKTFTRHQILKVFLYQFDITYVKNIHTAHFNNKLCSFLLRPGLTTFNLQDTSAERLHFTGWGSRDFIPPLIMLYELQDPLVLCGKKSSHSLCTVRRKNHSCW